MNSCGTVALYGPFFFFSFFMADNLWIKSYGSAASK